MQLATADRDEGLIGLLAQRWHAWKESRAVLAGLNACGGGEVARIAHDLSLTPRELRMLVRRGSDAASQLYRRMADLGLDRGALAHHQPAVLRQMQKDCSLCASKGRCRHDLARGAEPSTWHAYCPNDDVLTALAAGGARRVRRTAGAATALVDRDRRRWHSALLGLLLIGIGWVVLAGYHSVPGRHSPLTVAPAATPVPNASAVACLDGTCLDARQREALHGLRMIQSQGWLASSIEQRATVSEASLIAADVRAGEAAVCVQQGGMTYFGFMFDNGCSAGANVAAKLDGYNECRPMAGGGACLLR